MSAATPTLPKSKLNRLLTTLRTGSNLLIVLQDNPDPDAIGSAVALRELANRRGNIPCTIVHGGRVGRAENRALVRYLDLAMRRFDAIDIDRFDVIAMLDTQPATGNNSLPRHVLPDIVIDHHPIQPLTRRATFHDIRSRIGATSTILWQYLHAARVTPDVRTATAMLYGIRSDTQDLERESTAADARAYEHLYPLANKRMLGSIQRGSVSSDYYQILSDALCAARTFGPALVCNLRHVANPDMMGEMADLFLRHEDVTFVLCFGIVDDRLQISLRCDEGTGSCADIARAIATDLGTAGGHATFAGAQIPLTPLPATTRRSLDRLLTTRFLDALNLAAQTRPKRLVHP